MKNKLILLPIFSFFWFAAAIIIAGSNFPHYQHSKQYISELAALGAPHADLIRFFGFIPASILLTAFAVVALIFSEKRIKQIVGLLGVAVYALTLSMAAIYQCDFGCRPEQPSWAQNMHNLSALIGYPSGILAIFMLASDLKDNSKKYLSVAKLGHVLSYITLALFFCLNPLFEYLGVAQRLLEFILYCSCIFYAWYLQTLR